MAGGDVSELNEATPLSGTAAPARGTQQIVLNVGYRVAFILRQPNVHPNLLRASLHSQGLGTEERGSRLPRHVVERETEGPCFGPQFQTDLGHAEGVIGADVVDALDSPKSFDQGGCDRSETLGVGMRQHDLDGVAQVDNLAAESHTTRVRQHTRLLPPGLHDLRRGGFPLLGAQQLEFDGGDVGFGIQGGRWIETTTFDPRSLAYGHGYPGQKRRRIRGLVHGEALNDPLTGRLQFLRDFVGSLSGRPVRHLEDGRCEVALAEPDEAGRNDPSHWHGNAEDKQRDRTRDRHPRPIRRELQPAVQGSLHKPLQQHVDATLNSGEESVEAVGGLPIRAVQVLGQMVGQHQQRFDQGDHQHGDDDDRYRSEHLTDASWNEDQGHERRDRGQHGKDQRHLDPPRAANRRGPARRAPHPLQMDVLGDDDGVVHDDSDGENEREQRYGVDADVERHHDGQGADARNREADGYPEGEPYLEKQGQRDQHQQQPQDPILEEDIGALRIGLGFVVPNGDAHAVREPGNRLLLNVRPNGPGDAHHLLVVRTRDLDEDSRLSLVPHDQVRVREAVAYPGHIAQTHDRAVAAAQEDDLFEVLLIVALADRPQPNLRLPGVDGAGGKVQGTAANRVRDVDHGESEGSQPPKRHLD